jgi:hypothetical protein
MALTRKLLTPWNCAMTDVREPPSVRERSGGRPVAVRESASGGGSGAPSGHAALNRTACRGLGETVAHEGGRRGWLTAFAPLPDLA